jgi:hypothetical protein
MPTCRQGFPAITGCFVCFQQLPHSIDGAALALNESKENPNELSAHRRSLVGSESMKLGALLRGEAEAPPQESEATRKWDSTTKLIAEQGGAGK